MSTYPFSTYTSFSMFNFTSRGICCFVSLFLSRKIVKRDRESDLRSKCNFACSPPATHRVFPPVFSAGLVLLDWFSGELSPRRHQRSRSCRGVATPVTVTRAIAYLFLPTSDTHAIAQTIGEPLFRRKKETKRSRPAAYISWLIASSPVGSLSEVDRPMPRTILESGSRHGPALSA